MKKLLPLLGLCLSLGSAFAAGEAAPAAASQATLTTPPVASASAAAPSDKRKAQQAKMKTCNQEAKAQALKGAERKAFMKDCLKNKG